MIELKLRVGPFRFQLDLWRNQDGEPPPNPDDGPPHTVGGALIGFSSHAEPSELARRDQR